MNDDLQKRPTSELTARAKRSPVEKMIGGIGFPLALILIVCAWIAAFWYAWRDVCFTLYVCCIASILIPFAIISTFNFLADFRNRRVIRELDRRFGRWPFSSYVRYYREHAPSNTTVCIFRGAALPHGSQYWARMLFNDRGNSCDAAAIRGRYFGAGPDPWDDVALRLSEVPPHAASEIVALIDKTKGTGKTSFQQMVKDGFPASLAIIHADGSKPTIVLANLCGLSAEQCADDRIRLLMAVGSVICKERELWMPTSDS